MKISYISQAILVNSVAPHFFQNLDFSKSNLNITSAYNNEPQNWCRRKVKQTLAIAEHGYVLATGKIVMEGTGAALLNNEHIKITYLGV